MFYLSSLWCRQHCNHPGLAINKLWTLRKLKQLKPPQLLATYLTMYKNLAFFLLFYKSFLFKNLKKPLHFSILPDLVKGSRGMEWTCIDEDHWQNLCHTDFSICWHAYIISMRLQWNLHKNLVESHLSPGRNKANLTRSAVITLWLSLIKASDHHLHHEWQGLAVITPQ